MSLVGGADLNGTASGDQTDLRFDRPYRASPTGLGSGGLSQARAFARQPEKRHRYGTVCCL
eukprot:2355434-Pleurochrysis_carterae.AAC.1